MPDETPRAEFPRQESRQGPSRSGANVGTKALAFAVCCCPCVCVCVCPWFSRVSARTGLSPPPSSGSSSGRRRAAVFWSPQRPSNVLLPFRGTEGDGSGVPKKGRARFAGIGLTSSGAGLIKSHAIVTRVHA